MVASRVGGSNLTLPKCRSLSTSPWDLKAQTITLHEGDKTALQYLGAAVVLQWSSMPEDVRKALLRQADAVGGLPLVSDLHEQIQALIRRVRTD